MSDRTAGVLRNIDDLLAGADWEGDDAMRWHPPETEEPAVPVEWPEGSFAAAVQTLTGTLRDLGRNAQEEVERLVPGATGRHKLRRVSLLLEAFAVTVPDETERAAYLDAAGGRLERAISLAQWGIPPELAAANPDASIHDLARQAHTDRSTT